MPDLSTGAAPVSQEVRQGEEGKEKKGMEGKEKEGKEGKDGKKGKGKTWQFRGIKIQG